MTDTAFYNSKAVLFARQMLKRGFTASFVKKGQAGGTGDYGNTISATPDVTVSGLVSTKLSFKQSQIDGVNILQSDGYVFFDPDSGKPEVGCEITLNGVVWRVVGDMSFINPDGQVMYLKYQLRA